MKQRLKLILYCFVLIISCCIENSFALSLLEAQEKIENDMEKGGDGSFVVRFKNIHTLPKSSSFEIISSQIQNNKMLRVTVGLDGKTYNITASLDKAKYIVVPAKIISKDLAISDIDLKIIKVPELHYRGNYATSKDILVGRFAKRQLVVNKPISLNDIKQEAIIKQNERIMILYKSHGLSIEASGIALEDGGMGERIKVKNDDTNKTLTGKVLNNKVILVE